MKTLLLIQKVLVAILIPQVRIGILTFITSCWISQNSFAQTPAELSNIKAELNKITQAYTKCKQLTLEATSSSYGKSTDKKPESSESFSMKIKGGSLYYKTNGMERISNPSLSVIVDHKDKTLILDKGSDLRVKGDPRKVFHQDEVLNSCSSIVPVAVDADTKGYKFFFKQHMYHSIEIHFNSNSHLIEKVIMIYNNNGEEGAKVDVRYTLTDPITPINDETFSVDKYVIVSPKNKPVQVTAAYKEYYFVNHLN